MRKTGPLPRTQAPPPPPGASCPYSAQRTIDVEAGAAGPGDDEGHRGAAGAQAGVEDGDLVARLRQRRPGLGKGARAATALSVARGVDKVRRATVGGVAAGQQEAAIGQGEEKVALSA